MKALGWESKTMTSTDAGAIRPDDLLVGPMRGVARAANRVDGEPSGDPHGLTCLVRDAAAGPGAVTDRSLASLVPSSSAQGPSAPPPSEASSLRAARSGGGMKQGPVALAAPAALGRSGLFLGIPERVIVMNTA